MGTDKLPSVPYDKLIPIPVVKALLYRCALRIWKDVGVKRKPGGYEQYQRRRKAV